MRAASSNLSDETSCPPVELVQLRSQGVAKGDPLGEKEGKSAQVPPSRYSAGYVDEFVSTKTGS